MNGTLPPVEIIRPFSEAFELMKKILFQPFDLKKWFVIGFAAWLANLGSYGFRFNYSRGDWQQVPIFREINEILSQIPPWLIVLGVTLIIVTALGLAILFAWLRARARFIFIDCIVKNRGAIVGPWREFARQGNSFFFFALLTGCGVFLMGAVAALPFLLFVFQGTTFTREYNVYLIGLIVLWTLVVLAFVFAWMLIAHFMVVVMYRRRCLAPEAFWIAISLIRNYLGEITLYCLFWILLGIGAAIAACATILATCCIALLPYIGTVIMLPIFVCLRAYDLRFIRQFGPEYDVWSGISQPPPLPP